jgi:hypothetical protein
MSPSTHTADVSQIETDTAAILVDTGTTIPATIATVDGIVDAILVDTGTTIPATIATVDGNVDAILVDTGTTIPGTITTMQTDTSSILTGSNAAAAISTEARLAELDAANIPANVDAVLVDTGTTIPATIATAQTDLDELADSYPRIAGNNTADATVSGVGDTNVLAVTPTLPSGSWFGLFYTNWYGTTAGDVVVFKALVGGVQKAGTRLDVVTAETGQVLIVPIPTFSSGTEVKLMFNRASGSGTIHAHGCSLVVFKSS